jgi:nuclear pore complex protein Nup98-Nup96
VSYQTITFQQPYQTFSLEELRVADYAQGRKYGNQNGQAGAFGTSTGFGGFGSNNNTNTTSSGFGAANNTSSGGGLFGSSTATSGFGSGQQQNTSGFGGGNTSGGLFGAKPAGSGGLFGQQNNTATSGQQSGGLFGTSGGTGFGATGNNTSSTGGGLFGGGNNAQQNKPAFGGFGGGNSTFGNNNTASSGFGQQSNASSGGGGLFGNTATSGGFGNNQQKPAFGGFGQNQTQNQPQPAQNTGGGLFGGGFGNNNQQQQQKPGGLFGASTGNTGGGLFGNNQQQPQQQSGGLFGGANNQQNNNTGGGLFGNKPATGGLFGNSNNATNNTGGGLFGNAGNQQNAGGSSLFGNKPATGGGLFGNNNAASTNTGGGLFGGSLGQGNQNNNQAAGSSLFGNAGPNQQQQSQNNSLFGSQQNTANQSVSSLTTSLNTNPYGHDQLFANLSTPSQSIGPLATPLSNSQKMKKSAVLPQYKVNPNASSRLITPQKRTQGYGFSYSTYGTPGSAISTGGSPAGGFGNSLLAGGSLGRSLGKSVSMSNLRYSQSAEDSILAPGAFSTNSGRALANGGSIKRLNVDRGLGHIRTPLFGDVNGDGGPKKRVSFGPSTTGDNAITNGTSNGTGLTPSNGALVPTEPHSPSTPTPGDRASGRATNGIANGNSTPEMTQVNGNELAIVPEHDSPESPEATQKRDNEKAKLTQRDQAVGAYWMQPSAEELKKMPLDKLKKLENFVVGRNGVGQIEFSCVDLSDTPIDRICDNIVVLKMRSATVYGDNSPVPKPPVGKGLNVPSVISLENSFPRAQGGKVPVYEKKGIRFDKHLERLKRVPNTEFIDYEKKSGTWKFRVQHYTTYGLDDDDDDEDYEDYPDSSMMEPEPGTPTPKSRTPVHSSTRSHSSDDVFMPSPDGSDPEPDDTFDFKNMRSSRSMVPGGFDDEQMLDDAEPVVEPQAAATQPFLDERSVGSLAEMEQDKQSDVSERSESDSAEDPFMAGRFPSAGRTTEHGEQSPSKDATQPKSILKTSQNPFTQSNLLGSAMKPRFTIESDWTEQLQRTASPKKDRQALRQSQAALLNDQTDKTASPTNPIKSTNNPTFHTGLDLMKSLFGSESGRKSTRGKKQTNGIEV